MCVDHPVERGWAGIAQAVDRLAGGRADLPVLRSPRVVREPDAGSQQLGARVQQRIVQGGAEPNGLLDCRDAAVRIENGEGTDQPSQRVYLGGRGSCVGRPRCCGFVGFGALDPRAAPVVRIADALQQLDLQCAGGVRGQVVQQGSRVLEHPDRVTVGEASGGVLRRDDEVADGPAVVARFLEVPCQRAGNRCDLRAIGLLEPFAESLVQSQAATPADTRSARTWGYRLWVKR